MKRQTSPAFTIAAFLLALAVVGYLAHRSSRASSAERSAPRSSIPAPSGPLAPSAARPAPEAAPEVSRAQPAVAPSASPERLSREATISQIAPSSHALRESGLKNLEATPPELTRFSIELGGRADAIASEREAADFMTELEACVSGTDADGARFAEPVQWLCLRNAGQVASRFRGVSGRFAQLRSLASPGVDQLLD